MSAMLNGKVALVAGATRGAGRGIAVELGAAGATVYVTGRSQQELIREALDRYLGVGMTPGSRSMDRLIASGAVIPPEVPYRRPHRLITLPDGITSLDLLDREDRF